ncbi:MAG: 50S ribosomal protein L44e [Candidatus Diapherotrites archaeon]|nr:50S ribosomal protein L44e [Candidatus Diapherotrites archaeon]
MDIPKQIKDYCPKCKVHAVHKLKYFKAASPRALSWGTRENVRKHKKGYGGKAEFTATVKKQNKKPTFLAECETCKSKHYYRISKRMKKTELV